MAGHAWADVACASPRRPGVRRLVNGASFARQSSASHIPTAHRPARKRPERVKARQRLPPVRLPLEVRRRRPQHLEQLLFEFFLAEGRADGVARARTWRLQEMDGAWEAQREPHDERLYGEEGKQ